MKKISMTTATALCGTMIQTIQDHKGIDTIYQCNDTDVIITTNQKINPDNIFALQTIQGVPNEKRGLIVPILS